MPRCVRLALVALLLWPAAARVEARPAVPRVDAKRILDLATRWMRARPKTQFERWDRSVRQALVKEAAAYGPLPEGSRAHVLDLIFKAVKKHGPKGKGSLTTPYGEATWIQKGRGGSRSGLVIGLHGGGPGAGSASEATKWTLPGHMGMYPQGIVLVHDTWNSVHGERFVLTLIEIAKAQYDVDPDRVYAMGFSMGGSGSMFLAGRHPDLLAGAIPAHGVIAAKGGSKIPLEKDVGEMEHGLLPNLRNLAVYFYTGTADKNCEPGTFCKAWSKIRDLRKGDPEGYAEARFRNHEGIPHTFPPGEPSGGYAFLRDRRRHPYPVRIAWEYNEDPWPQPAAEDEGKATRRAKHWMYWLHCAAPRDRMLVTVTRRDEGDAHVITLQHSGQVFRDDFTIYLNEAMFDVSKEVVVRVGGEQVWRGRPQPDLVSILESLDAKLDRTLTFDRRIAIPE